MVAEHRGDAAPPQGLDDLFGLGTVTDTVSKAIDGIGRRPVQILKHFLKGVHIPVDVRKHGDPHSVYLSIDFSAPQ
jgi:hypothetical protein